MMPGQDRPVKLPVRALRLSVLLLISILLLPPGCIGAQAIWHYFHHRSVRPETGFYHGGVRFWYGSWEEPIYSLRFTGDSAPRWYWRPPKSIKYTTLDVEWRGQSSEGKATVDLSNFSYRMNGTGGPFTRGVLADWVVGGPTNQTANLKHVETVFGYFLAAADGSLPPPLHHGYVLDDHRVHIQHEYSGYGVGSTVYAWFAVWLFSVIFIGRRISQWNPGR
jgi:hypothetical protein